MSVRFVSLDHDGFPSPLLLLIGDLRAVSLSRFYESSQAGEPDGGGQ